VLFRSGFVGSDYLSVRPDYRTIPNPFGQGEVILVPAIQPQVCFLHGLAATDAGEVLIDRSTDADLAAKGAEVTVVSVESRVADLEAVRTRETKFLPGLYVDYLVEAPEGARPTACPGFYPGDHDYLRHYLQAAKAGQIQDWFQERQAEEDL
jgi:glutaconate CoA-transferase subunit A